MKGDKGETEKEDKRRSGSKRLLGLKEDDLWPLWSSAPKHNTACK